MEKLKISQSPRFLPYSPKYSLLPIQVILKLLEGKTQSFRVWKERGFLARVSISQVEVMVKLKCLVKNQYFC